MSIMKITKIIAAWLIMSLWAGVACGGTVTYVYTDAQDTPIAEADANGNITARFYYMPYGAPVPSMGPAPDGPGYTGHVNDPDTGLVYMQARYYDPAVGRFLSVDPVGPSPGNTFNFNRYNYANNNPVRHTDPDGRCPDTAFGCGSLLKAHVQERQSHPNAPADGLEKAALVGVGAMVGAALAPISPELAVAAKVVVRKVHSRATQADDSASAASSVTKRPSNFRKRTVQGAWDNAAEGSTPGSKACPTCQKDVQVAPGQGRRDWDVDHQPKWKDRDLSGMDRRQVLDEYNKGVRLRCPSCNRSDN